MEEIYQKKHIYAEGWTNHELEIYSSIVLWIEMGRAREVGCTALDCGLIDLVGDSADTHQGLLVDGDGDDSDVRCDVDLVGWFGGGVDANLRTRDLLEWHIGNSWDKYDMVYHIIISTLQQELLHVRVGERILHDPAEWILGHSGGLLEGRGGWLLRGCLRSDGTLPRCIPIVDGDRYPLHHSELFVVGRDSVRKLHHDGLEGVPPHPDLPVHVFVCI